MGQDRCPITGGPLPAPASSGGRTCARCGAGAAGGAPWWCGGRAPLPPAGAATALGEATAQGEPGGADLPAEGRPWVAGYRLLDALGQGGGGAVYRAFSEALGREVALKIVAGHRHATSRLRFQQEIELARAHADLAVVPVLDAGATADGAPWYAMELVEGPSLADALEGEPRPRLAALAAIVAQSAATLGQLHRRGVVHRDVKPANILITPEGQTLLADLGIAWSEESERLTRTGRFVGSLPYMAPEQLSGAVADWARVDIYALGRVLQDCLAAAGEPDRALGWIAERAMHPEPARRYPDADALAADLRRWLEGRRAALLGVRLAHRAREAASRHGRVVAIVLALIAVPAVIAQLARLNLLAGPKPEPELIGRWTFEPGAERADLTGSWGELVLGGDASISGGQLDVNGAEKAQTGWAYARGFYPASGADSIAEKTLVAWVSLDSAATRGGSALTLDRVGDDAFDAIVYGELEEGRWGAGSSYYRRSNKDAVAPSAAPGRLQQVALVYEGGEGDAVLVTLCLDGVQQARYAASPLATWRGADAEVVFGARHTLGDEIVPGALDARIEEARIYRGALSCEAIGRLAY